MCVCVRVCGRVRAVAAWPPLQWKTVHATALLTAEHICQHRTARCAPLRYVTAFHNNVIYVNNRTVGFELTRSRVVANSFFGGNGVGTSRGADGQSNVTWSMEAPGPLLAVLGSEYVVANNTLYSDGVVISSTTKESLCPVQSGPHAGHTHCHGSQWGLVTGNSLYNHSLLCMSFTCILFSRFHQ